MKCSEKLKTKGIFADDDELWLLDHTTECLGEWGEAWEQVRNGNRKV